MLILETGHELINTPRFQLKLICNGEYFCLTQIARSKKGLHQNWHIQHHPQKYQLVGKKRTIKRTRLILIRICKT